MKRILLGIALGLASTVCSIGQETPKPKTEAVTFLTAGKSQPAEVILATGPVLQPLGVHPVLGRDFIKEDFAPSSSPVAIISQAVWVAATGSQVAILGEKIRVGEREYIIVAVAPKSPAAVTGLKVWLAAQ